MLDSLQIQFDPASLVLLNILLAFMMFGASLSLRIDDFKYVIKQPKAPLIGLFSQFILMPAATFLLTRALDVDASLALGMILVASCPGGSFSNIMTWLARGHLATSVSMTGISTLAALIMTPLNFAFYANLHPSTAEILRAISIDPWDVMSLVAMVLVLPLGAAMLVRQVFPKVAKRLDQPFRYVSLLGFLIFVTIAFTNNGDLFVSYYDKFIGLVVLHNAIALAIGFTLAKIGQLSEAEVRAVTLEVGIQNSGLGLVLLFSFFPNLGGMMIITAFWGVWHLVTGLLLAFYWAKIAPPIGLAY